MNLKRERFVYYILSPLNGDVKYVGVTNNPILRFKQHLRECEKKNKNGLIYFYLRFLKENKLKPILKIKQKIFASYTDSEFIEAEHIEKNIDTVLNEMYGNGMHIKKNVKIKKKLIEDEINIFDGNL